MSVLLFFLLLKMNISDRGGKNMKSKIVRGIINGGVLAAVAALVLDDSFSNVEVKNGKVS